jgi:DNA-binding MarR family transcriptional regulator
MDVATAVAAVQLDYPRVWHKVHSTHSGTHAALSPRDVGVLVHVLSADGASPTELAAHLGLSGGTLSDALGDLEARGLVVRTRHHDDKRRVAVSATDAGRAAVRVGSGLDPERLGRALGRLSAAERDVVIEGLRLLAGACATL